MWTCRKAGKRLVAGRARACSTQKRSGSSFRCRIVASYSESNMFKCQGAR